MSLQALNWWLRIQATYKYNATRYLKSELYTFTIVIYSFYGRILLAVIIAYLSISVAKADGNTIQIFSDDDNISTSYIIIQLYIPLQMYLV